jgi:hypothetical protein
MAQDVALRKRQQIAKASRIMFLWVTAASVVVGVSMVVSVFLIQKLLFNEKILGEKQKTVDTLVANNKVADTLKEKIRVLNTNQALLDARTEAEKVVIPGNESRPLQVVLDALPSDINSTALGSSLQEVLLKSDKITIESLSVDSVSSDGLMPLGATGNTISFNMSVSAPMPDAASSLQALLGRLERSIRPIDVLTVNIETQGTKIVMTISAQAFYEPAITTELKTKVIKP